MSAENNSIRENARPDTMKLRRDAKLIAFSKSNYRIQEILFALVIIQLTIAHAISIFKPLTSDIIAGTRCNIRCRNGASSDEKLKCFRNCLLMWTKPGSCPGEFVGVVDLEKPCINSCTNDSDCTGVLKCCPHSCGVTCQTPIHLDITPGLPAVPDNINVDVDQSNVASQGLPIIVSWSIPNGTNRGRTKSVVYLVEERHEYNKFRFDESPRDWAMRQQSITNNVTIKNLFKPGGKYQFRITAINENGTRGPSEATQPFSYSSAALKEPEPPPNFDIGARSWGNGKLHLDLIWKKPISPLPLNKYEVIWGTLKNFTFVQYHHHLSSDVNHFWLRNLEPNTKYFVQVRALAKFGKKKKLVGKPSAIVFTTPNQHQSSKKPRRVKPEQKKLKYKRSIKHICVEKIYWLRDQLYANLTWNPVKKSQINYSITWSHNGCYNEGKALYIAKTDEPNFEVYDLQPQCNYNVSIKTVWKETLYKGGVTFSTVNCTRNEEPTSRFITKI